MIDQVCRPGAAVDLNPFWFHVSVLFYELLTINVLLAVFNLIPVPPLDGSHVLRHFLPEPVRRVYDTVGMFGLLLLVLSSAEAFWMLMVTP